MAQSWKLQLVAIAVLTCWYQVAGVSGQTNCSSAGWIRGTKFFYNAIISGGTTQAVARQTCQSLSFSGADLAYFPDEDSYRAAMRQPSARPNTAVGGYNRVWIGVAPQAAAATKPHGGFMWYFSGKDIWEDGFMLWQSAQPDGAVNPCIATIPRSGYANELWGSDEECTATNLDPMCMVTFQACGVANDMCPYGSFRNSTTTHCEECPAGTFTNSYFATACTSCPANTFAASAGSTACAQCPHFAFSGAQASACTNCPHGRAYNLNTMQCEIQRCVGWIRAGDWTYGIGPPEMTWYGSRATCPTTLNGATMAMFKSAAEFDAFRSIAAPALYNVSSLVNSNADWWIGIRQPDLPSTPFAEPRGGWVYMDGTLLANTDLASDSTRFRTDDSSSTPIQACAAYSIASATASQFIDDKRCQFGQSSNRRLCQVPHTACVTQCPVGHIEDGFTCVGDCRAGSIQATTATGSTTCANCTAGSFATNGACVPCQAGKFSAVNGSVSCQDCPRGRFQAQSGASMCQTCPEFSRADSPGMTACVTECPVGKMLMTVNETDSCVSCPLGKSSNFGAISCFPCENGMYRDASSVVCIPCPSGSFSGSSSSGFSTCSVCPFGQTSTPRSTSCFACAEGWFYPSTSGASGLPCERCPDNSFSTNGSIGVQSCTCIRGFFGLPRSGKPCRSCSGVPGIACPGGMEAPAVRNGFFRDPEDPDRAIECIPAEACAFSQAGPTQCNTGYKGPYCKDCVPFRFYRSGTRCRKCIGTAVKIIAMVAFFVVILFIAMRFTLSTSAVVPVDVRVTLRGIQTIGTFSLFTHEWPVSVQWLISIGSLSNIDISVFSPECSIPLNFWFFYNIKMLLPIFLILCVGVLQLLLKSLSGLRAVHRFLLSYDLVNFAKMNIPELLFNLVACFISLVSFTYANILIVALQPFFCTKAASSSLSRLVEDPSQVCYSASWNKNIIAAVLYVLLYGIGVPGFLAYVFYKRHVKNRSRFEALAVGPMSGYKSDCYGWELNVMFSRALFSITVNLLAPFLSSRSRQFILIDILMVRLLLDNIWLPYITHLGNFVNTV